MKSVWISRVIDQPPMCAGPFLPRASVVTHSSGAEKTDEHVGLYPSQRVAMVSKLLPNCLQLDPSQLPRISGPPADPSLTARSCRCFRALLGSNIPTTPDPGMQIRDGIIEAIGNTPLIKLKRVSEATGCTILGKAEFMNPGGSVKDRAGLYIILDAEKRGALKPGGLIVEGTAGNTGIGLALVGNARGYRTLIVIPETQSREKKDMLRLCGAELREVPAVPYKGKNNYVHVSERLAHELGAFWANQWDNTANRDGHFRSTGPEIWEQTQGQVHGFTCSIGTGGTLSGVSAFLKTKNPKIRIAVADPMGAAMYRWFKEGELK